jgi:hypothetical protein
MAMTSCMGGEEKQEEAVREREVAHICRVGSLCPTAGRPELGRGGAFLDQVLRPCSGD